MIIRPAEIQDIPVITAIWNREVQNTAVTFTTQEKGTDDIAQMIETRADAFLVAEQENMVLGFVTMSSFRTGPGYVHTAEHSVHLDHAARGQGIGRKLLEALEIKARAKGIHVLVAAISGENPAAMQFHSACGYIKVGILPQVGRKFDRWMDLVLMQKIL